MRAIQRHQLESKMVLAYDLGCRSKEDSHMTEVEYVAGVVTAIWGANYKTDTGWIFPKRVTLGHGIVGEKVWCRKSSVWQQ